MDGVSLSKLPPEHSPMAQWQSTRLLIEWLLVRIQLGEQKDPGRIAWVFLYLRGRELGRVSYMRNQTRIAASTTPARYVTASLS